LNKAEFLSNFVFHGGRVTQHRFVVLSTNFKVRLNRQAPTADISRRNACDVANSLISDWANAPKAKAARLSNVDCRF
jgi:hypothetical protein